MIELAKGVAVYSKTGKFKGNIIFFINFPKLSVYKLLPFNNNVSYGVVVRFYFNNFWPPMIIECVYV